MALGTPYDDKDLGQHWLGNWIDAWWQQTIIILTGIFQYVKWPLVKLDYIDLSNPRHAVWNQG